MTARDQLLKDIRRFLRESGMSPTRFSLESTGRRDLMTRLNAGKDMQLSTYESVRAYLDRASKKKPRELSMSA